MPTTTAVWRQCAVVVASSRQFHLTSRLRNSYRPHYGGFCNRQSRQPLQQPQQQNRATTSGTPRFSPQNSNPTPPPLPPPPPDYSNTNWDWGSAFVARLVAAFGMVHVVSEYGIELTLCEGPSMLPTIHPSGEIIMVDRFTPRMWGLKGGSKGEERAQLARKLQETFEQQRTQDKQEKKDAYYEWYEPLIPANELPDRGTWTRMWKQLTTGIAVGDVVVVQHPNRSGTVCKRVLGLPGDVVVRPPGGSGSSHNMRQNKYRRDGLLVIPDGHVWLEGDNTMNSSDSRTYGPIPAALVVGRVLARVWPLRGNAIMQRGARPLPPPNEPFSGSTILPTGYEGETIVHHTKTIEIA